MLQAGETYEGQVKHFNDEKGWGFIKISGEEEVFVHYRDVPKNENGRHQLRVGQNVKFKLIWVADREKFKAVEVSII